MSLGLALPGAALAAPTTAVVTSDLNIRTGPAAVYQRYGTIPAGDEVTVFGCLADYGWCDVGWDGERGWVNGGYLAYGGRRYYREPIPRVAVRIGVPVYGFDPYDYHRRYYAGRSWYRDRYLDRRDGDFARDRDRRRERREDFRDARRDLARERRDFEGDRRAFREEARDVRREDRRENRRERFEDRGERREERGERRSGREERREDRGERREERRENRGERREERRESRNEGRDDRAERREERREDRGERRPARAERRAQDVNRDFGEPPRAVMRREREGETLDRGRRRFEDE